MEVVKAPASVLRVKTKPVKKITPEILKVAKEMIKLTKSFKDPEGVGLAANQVGRTERFFIARNSSKKNGNDDFLICFNPKILSVSPKTKVYFEGCLSIPNYYGETQRSLSINVEYQDKTGQKVVRRLQGMMAWIFQHEIGHLDGELFMDKVLQQKGKVYRAAGRDKAGAEIFEEVKIV